MDVYNVNELILINFGRLDIIQDNLVLHVSFM